MPASFVFVRRSTSVSWLMARTSALGSVAQSVTLSRDLSILRHGQDPDSGDQAGDEYRNSKVTHLCPLLQSL